MGRNTLSTPHPLLQFVLYNLTHRTPPHHHTHTLNSRTPRPQAQPHTRTASACVHQRAQRLTHAHAAANALQAASACTHDCAARIGRACGVSPICACFTSAPARMPPPASLVRSRACAFGRSVSVLFSTSGARARRAGFDRAWAWPCLWCEPASLGRLAAESPHCSLTKACIWCSRARRFASLDTVLLEQSVAPGCKQAQSAV